MASETHPSACCTLSDESSIPFYSTSNGYKNIRLYNFYFLIKKYNTITLLPLKTQCTPETVDQKDNNRNLYFMLGCGVE